MNVAVFYGGKSCEHDVSIVTGVQTLNAIIGERVIPVYVTRRGEWRIPKHPTELSAYRGAVKGKSVHMRPSSACLYTEHGREYARIDVAVICTHGNGGEDGCLQGWLELCGVPYTGSGVAASAIGMNKSLCKRVFTAAGLNTLAHELILRPDYEHGLRSVIERAALMGYPLIVKPNSLGSSIGVKKVNGARELIEALNVAFEWDNSVIIERALVGFTELNCAVLACQSGVIVSEVEQPVGLDDVLSYADKYERGGFKSARRFPADIPEELTKMVKTHARAAFDAIGASGVARVDFLYDNAQQKLYVNEINTVPGSLSTYLFEPDMTANSVIHTLMDTAMAVNAAKTRLKYKFTSPTLRGK